MLQNLMRKMKKDNKGFTLVELMIVVVIIGILIAIAIPVYSSIQTNAERRACQANMRTILSQIEVYKAENNGVAPTADAAAFTAFLGSTTYFAQTPVCPSGTGAYTYAGSLVVCPNQTAATVTGHVL